MRSCVLSCMTFFLAATACSAKSGGLTLFENGSTRMKIVLPVAATDAEKDAAGELKQFLDRASGASFEIVTEDDADTGGLFVGRTRLAREWRLPPAPPTPEKDEGFAIEVRGDARSIVLVGTIDMATKFAVYDFLDRFAGIRWFLPGRLFEVVPKHDRLTISDCSIRELPALSGRFLGAALGTRRSADDPDPQFGPPSEDFHIDTSRRGEQAARWAVRNLFSVDGRLSSCFHGHNLGRVVPGSHFRNHPEYFPKRYRAGGVAPPVGRAGWQPCTSEPGVLPVALDWGRDFFRRNPEHWAWFSLGINDGGGWCAGDRCKALDVRDGQFRGQPIFTDRYLTFVRQVADAMLKEFPDRKVSLLAYHTTVVPPDTREKLPPNVVVVITRDSFQYHDPDYLAADLEADKRWVEVANGNLYRYDYYGFGWLVPRYYPHRLAEDVRRMRDIGVKGILAEDMPVWPAAGPSYYVAAKLWWNPDRDVDALIDEFHTTLFGPAAEPVARYWARHEEVWLKERPGEWFEALGDVTAQANVFSPDDLDYLDRQLAEAHRLAEGDELIRERIRFFEGGWALAGHYIREHHLLGQLQAAETPEATAGFAQQLLAAVQARRAFWAKYREEPRFPGQEKGPCEDYRYVLEEVKRVSDWEKRHSGVLALVALRIASQSPQAYERLLAHYRAAEADDAFVHALESASVLELTRTAPNLVRNPAFDLGDGNARSQEGPGTWPSNGSDWVTRGAAQHWAQYAHATGSFSFDNGVARIHGTDSGLWIQTFAVTPGDQIVGRVQYRLRAGPRSHARLAVSWMDRSGQWLGPDEPEGFDARYLGPADDWQEVLCRHVVPEGAATAVFQLGASDLNPDEAAEFRKPYLGRIAP